MASCKVQTLVRKPLPFLFDPTSKFYPIILGGAICLLVILTVISIHCRLNIEPGVSSSAVACTNERTDLIVTTLNLMGGWSQSFVSTIWIIYHRRQIGFIKNKIYKLQKSVSYNKNLTLFSKRMYICYLFTVFCAVSQAAYEIKSWKHFYCYTAFLINITFSFVISGQLGILLQYIGSIYNNLLDTEDNESSVKCYQLLTNVLDDVFKLYKLPILLEITWNLTLSFVHLYLLLYPAFPGRPFINIIYSGWIAIFFFPTFSTIRSCNYINQQAKKFNKDLHRKMAEDKSRQLLNNELLHLHILVSEEPIFNVCGLFPLDNTLICSVISQMTTYLVIILQFAKSSGMVVKPAINEKPE